MPKSLKRGAPPPVDNNNAGGDDDDVLDIEVNIQPLRDLAKVCCR